MSSSRREAVRRSTRPSLMREVDIAVLSEAFNIPLGLDSDSDESDQEYAPHHEASSNDEGSSSGSSDSEKSGDSNDEDEEEEEEKEEEQIEVDGEQIEVEEIATASHIQDHDNEAQDHDGATALMEVLSPVTTAASTSPAPPPSNLSSTSRVPVCCVCIEKARHNDIVTCDMCGLSVHEGCYGVPEDDDPALDSCSEISSFTTAPWFCDACKAGVKNLCCELCPNDGGIFKQTCNGRWVHMVCSLYIPLVEYVDPKTLSGVSLDQLPASSWGYKSCQLCSDDWYSRTGVCISCDAGLCKMYFHVTCAQREGLLCEADDNSEDSKEEIIDAYFAHCTAHCDKQVAKRKRKEYLRLQQSCKSFKHDPSDERLLSHLRQSRKLYQAQFAELQQQHQSVETNCKRMLHHNPEAFKMLTEKAQLLGFVAKPAHPKVKRHGGRVNISLTCDFINYFHERDRLLEQQKKRNESLTATRDSLTQQQTAMALEQQQLEQELSQLQVARNKLLSDHENLASLLSKIIGETVSLSADQSEHHTNAIPQPAENQRSCSECSKTTDSHLMVSCDTCSNIYHIFCLDPPLTRVPKKSRQYGWQCENCCCDSDEDLKPKSVPENQPHTRSGRPLRSQRNFYLEEMYYTGSYHTH